MGRKQSSISLTSPHFSPEQAGMRRFEKRCVPNQAARSAANLAVLLLVAGAASHGCKSGGGQPSPPPGVALGTLTVTSTSFSSNGTVPVDQSCDGADKSPQLTFSAPPVGTQAFAIVAEDPDALSGTFTHWIVYNLPGDVRALAEGADPSTVGGTVGTNDFNRPGYSGPCPPKSELHHYFFRVFALNSTLDVKPGAARGAVDGAMSGHVLAEGTLVGLFSH
jgi:Raf kinase inhibitor-like YbhB/YbcL family protein